MAQSVNIPTMEDAHKKVMEKIAKIECFIRRDMTDDYLRPALREETSKLRRTMARRMFILKTFWHAKPNKARYKGLREWRHLIGPRQGELQASTEHIRRRSPIPTPDWTLMLGRRH